MAFKPVFCRVVVFIAALFISCTALSVKGESTSNSSPDGISAKAYLLMEAGTGRVVAAKNENSQLPIASTTKIITALITLEQPELDTPFVVDSQAIKTEGTSMGLRQGDTVTLRGLASGMLLPSGNDAANSAAVRISRSVPEFVKLMNERAAQIGMANTNFVTPSGLHDSNHYSTAYDMGLLTREALKNSNFADICSAEGIRLEYGNPPYSRKLTNHNRLLQTYPGCIGVKTGFTKKAGRCLVSAAESDGVTLICVTLSAPNDWQDHSRLLDYGFATVKKQELSASTEGITISVVGSEKALIGVELGGKAFACVEKEQVVQEVVISPFYYAPIEKGEKVGELRHIVNGSVVASTNLIAAEGAPYKHSSPKSTFWDKIISFFEKLF